MKINSEVSLKHHYKKNMILNVSLEERKIVIVIVSDVLMGEGNGTNVATMNLVRYLTSKGYEVRILSPFKGKDKVEHYYIVPKLNLGPFNYFIDKVGVQLAKADDEIIEKCLVDCDYIHAIVPFHLCNKVIRIAKERHIPVSCGFHMQAENLTSYFGLHESKFINKAVYKFIYKTTFSKCDAIHYPTTFIRDTFESNIKKITKGYVISNGVALDMKKKEVSKPKEYQDKIIISSVGRLAREKSQDTLIKALKYSKYEKDIQLIFAGQGLKEKKYRDLAKNLTNPIVMKQFKREEIVDLMNYSDLYVHPATIELEGIACIEALACQKVTIVSDSKKSATKSFVSDSRCIFKQRNPKDLARVIDYFIEHPEVRKQVEDSYQDFAKEHSVKNCMEKMEKMILETKEKVSKLFPAI